MVIDIGKSPDKIGDYLSKDDYENQSKDEIVDLSRNDISKIEEGSQLKERESLEKHNSTLILTEDDEDTRT